MCSGGRRAWLEARVVRAWLRVLIVRQTNKTLSMQAIVQGTSTYKHTGKFLDTLHGALNSLQASSSDIWASIQEKYVEGVVKERMQAPAAGNSSTQPPTVSGADAGSHVDDH